jgi:hypothetical protein
MLGTDQSLGLVSYLGSPCGWNDDQGMNGNRSKADCKWLAFIATGGAVYCSLLFNSSGALTIAAADIECVNTFSIWLVPDDDLTDVAGDLLHLENRSACRRC